VAEIDGRGDGGKGDVGIIEPVFLAPGDDAVLDAASGFGCEIDDGRLAYLAAKPVAAGGDVKIAIDGEEGFTAGVLTDNQADLLAFEVSFDERAAGEARLHIDEFDVFERALRPFVWVSDAIEFVEAAHGAGLRRAISRAHA
jgi:hypothetical protein